MSGEHTANAGNGIVFDIKRYTLHDGPGIRTTIHLKGCPLACLWCHNPESQSFKPQLLFRRERCIACGKCVDACPNQAVLPKNAGFEIESDRCSGLGKCADICPAEARELCGRSMSAPDAMKALLKDRIFFEQSGGGMTLSGGEPLSQPEFCIALLRACKRYEIHTAIDTCGFVGFSVLRETIPFTDLYLYDMKHMDPEKHKDYTGVDNEVILSNLVKLGECGGTINARIPFIPGINTDEKNLRTLASFLSHVKGLTQLNLLPYHNAAEDKHNRWKMDYKLKNLYVPTENALRSAAGIIESYGVKTVIGG